MEWQHLQQAVKGVGFFIGPIEEALVGIFLPYLLGETTVVKLLRKLLDLSAKRAEIGAPDTTVTAKK